MKVLIFVLITAILSFAVISYKKDVTPLVEHEKVIPTAPNTFLCSECPFLIPVIPTEVTFGNMIELESIMDLTPMVPMEADFDDCVDFVAERVTNDLAPVVPSQADFDDCVVLTIKQDSHLAPVVPSTADFNDIF